MSSPSNLYAEKIYAEQPIALWSLDDDCNFGSYFSTSNLALNTWTRSGGTSLNSVPENTDPYPKIYDANFCELITSEDVTLTSPNTFSSSSVFSAGMWVNPQTAINSITFTVGTLTKEFDMSGIEDTWVYLGHIFESPVSSENFVISIDVAGSTEIFFNGFSIGAGQNLYGTQSVGSQLTSAVSGLYGVQAFEYGLGQNNGWYIGNSTSKIMYATNSSIPMVYGSDSSTKIVENPDGPSVVVPGMGFLNESGRNQTLSFEAWMRIKTDGNTSAEPFRIFGPLGSTDGLYVNGQHLIIKADGEFSSHYVGEWFRPMLINIEYVPNKMSLFVNGELATAIDISSITLPDDTNDYLGFYAGGNVSHIELDCVAIYPYRITPVIAKRRFGYGQAVVLPSEIETAYSGRQIQIDYTFAGYSSDYSYPKIESWTSSLRENVYANRDIMGTPRLTNPDIVLSETFTSSNTDLSVWESDIADANEADADYPFIKMLPAEQWDSESGYIYLSSMRLPNVSSPRAFYVLAEASADHTDIDQVVFKIQNKDNLDSISAILSGTSLSYVYNISGTQGTLATKTVSSGSQFIAGFDFNQLYSSANSIVRRFLIARSRYALFVAGDYVGKDSEISTTFRGKVYGIGMSSQINFAKEGLSAYFTSGVANVSGLTTLIAKKPTYLFGLKRETFNEENVYCLDISTMSYFQDFIPLSKFAKVAPGTSQYVTDMLQISIDAEQSTVLDGTDIDSSNNDIKSFVFFDYATAVPHFGKDSSFTKTDLPYSKVADARSTWSGKKFEVVDGTVIMMPKENFATGKAQSDLVMFTLIEMYSKASLRMPIKIRTLEYAAQTFSRVTDERFNINNAKKIGTRSQSSSIYMFSESEGGFDPSAYNPVAISKNMSPYLYLTNKTGVKVLGEYSTTNDRGIYIPINQDASDQYFISLMSGYILYNDGEFPGEMTAFEIYDNHYSKLKVVIEATSDASIAKISIKKDVSGTWTSLDNVEFYINGTYTTSPTIKSGEWSNFGILFVTDPLDMSLTSDHRLEIVGSVLVNNISYYQLRPEELAQQVLPQEWNDYDTESIWSDIDTEFIWSEIAATEQFVRPELAPDKISKVYNGTNRILATADNDLTGISVEQYEYNIIKDTVSQNSVTITP